MSIHTREKWTNCPDRFTISPVRRDTYRKGRDKDGLNARQRRAIEAIKQEKANPLMYDLCEVWD